jgi:hypothetical protein
MWAENNGPDEKGAVFYFTLPIILTEEKRRE